MIHLGYQCKHKLKILLNFFNLKGVSGEGNRYVLFGFSPGIGLFGEEPNSMGFHLPPLMPSKPEKT